MRRVITFVAVFSLVNLNSGVYVERGSKPDVKFYFYSRVTHSGALVNSSDIASVESTDFSASKNSVFFVHGWHDAHDSGIPQSVKNAYLEIQDINVFLVDWSSISNDLYLVAFSNIKPIGQEIGEFIAVLVDTLGMNWGNIILSGHSLGAHIAGAAGQVVGGRVGQVVGLDPAGPLFTVITKDNRIDVSSGQLVQVIHTCSGLLGTTHSFGHADYWPNGGVTQPGCGTDYLGNCRHERAVKYFVESLKTGNFTSMKCDSYEEFQNQTCNGQWSSWMGQYALDRNASGNFYLDTNDSPPYAKGK